MENQQEQQTQNQQHFGYEKYKYVERDSSGYITFTTEDKKYLERKGVNVDKLDGKQLTEEELIAVGFTTDKTKIVNGENVLTIPVSEGYGGIVIKTSFGKYGILSSETTMHNNEPTYQLRLAPVVDSIYKRIDNRNCKILCNYRKFKTC